MDEVTSNSCPLSCTTEGDSGNKQVQLYPTMKISCNGRLEGLTVAGVLVGNLLMLEHILTYRFGDLHLRVLLVLYTVEK